MEGIGNKIRERRLKAGLTQKELGEKLGITESAINKLENRVTPPSVSTLERIAIAMDSKLIIEFE